VSSAKSLNRVDLHVVVILFQIGIEYELCGYDHWLIQLHLSGAWRVDGALKLAMYINSIYLAFDLLIHLAKLITQEYN
jgi:hypothetical protein